MDAASPIQTDTPRPLRRDAAVWEHRHHSNAPTSLQETAAMTTVDLNRFVVASRPRWAAESYFSPDTDQQTAVVHRWVAPTTARADNADRTTSEVGVELHATDDFVIGDQGVTVKLTDPVVFLRDFDATFSDTDEARKFAQAIIECCDRLDGVGVVEA